MSVTLAAAVAQMASRIVTSSVCLTDTSDLMAIRTLDIRRHDLKFNKYNFVYDSTRVAIFSMQEIMYALIALNN